MNISKKLSCGVLVLNKAEEILMLHVSMQSFWDIPKGTQEDGETPIQTAIRELKEESGVVAMEEDLIDLGFYFYNNYKDLWLFVMLVDELDVRALSCDSTFLSRDTEIPEVDEFRMIPISQAHEYMCNSMSYLFRSDLRSQLEDIRLGNLS